MDTGRQQHGARQREARAPPAPSAAPPSGGKAPRFGYLLKLGLESIGVRYISMDLLRKAKKGHTSEILKLTGRIAVHLLGIQMELVRFYLYEWGFVRTQDAVDRPSATAREEVRVYIFSILAVHDIHTALLDSVQMLEDEALFYKWINGLVLSLNHDNGTPNAQIESLAASNTGVYTALFAQIQDVQALFQANASSFQQIVHGYEEERRKWKTRQKSRSRLQQLDTKVERFTHEVQTRELFDPQKLFLRSERSWVILRLQDGVEAAQAVDGQPHLPTVDEVERLQKQLENVLGEITREYCGVHLR
ncbi:hypothetical protein BBJ28_00008839 [Nothophytophthora sp. Chile5]|nr:hypothetical protein BBJ28_00008839 [Nothophytophthora sp. Chile5]